VIRRSFLPQIIAKIIFIKVLNVLIELGADVNAVDNMLLTPLHLAAALQSSEVRFYVISDIL
jgi:ankyrin repeat protein